MQPHPRLGINAPVEIAERRKIRFSRLIVNTNLESSFVAAILRRNTRAHRSVARLGPPFDRCGPAVLLHWMLHRAMKRSACRIVARLAPARRQP